MGNRGECGRCAPYPTTRSRGPAKGSVQGAKSQGMPALSLDPKNEQKEASVVQIVELATRRSNEQDKLNQQRSTTRMNAKPYLLAMTTVVWTLNATTSFGQVFDSADVLSNRAVAASPRAQEEFPWLLRSVRQSGSSGVATPNTANALAVVKENGSLAASPRMREQFPELARPSIASSEPTTASQTGANALTEMRRNNALAASPRIQESFPELSRGVERVVEIAPLK